MDYTIFYKESFDNGNFECGQEYDFFFSGYDNCDRTKLIFDKVNSKQSIWIKFPHYNCQSPKSNVYDCQSFKEDEAFIKLFEIYEVKSSSNICIDITGFIKPHLIFFILCLYRRGINKIDFLYSEPKQYLKAEETAFSGPIESVELIQGCSSSISNPNTDNDLLIITAGYDNKLISRVSNEKDKIKKKVYILGFPSLQPDMYQEGVLNIKDLLGNSNQYFSPAFDPFVTAQTIHEIVDSSKGYTNIYLSPLSTKPQTLGILLYYLYNFQSKPINIIFPYSNFYHEKTAIGIKKTWKYTLELPQLS